MIARVLVRSCLTLAVILAGSGAGMLGVGNPCRAADPNQYESDQQRDRGGSQSTPTNPAINPRNPQGPQYLPAERPVNPANPGGAASLPLPNPVASTSEASSILPPKHHYGRAASHQMAGHHRGSVSALTGTTANQLNQDELSRLQSGAYGAPPPAGLPTPPIGTTGGGAP
jgi:hypothetical protein